MGAQKAKTVKLFSEMKPNEVDRHEVVRHVLRTQPSKAKSLQPFNAQDLISNYPYCLL